MNAYTGKILSIDLTTGRVKTSSFDEAFARDYIGGTGFGIKMLMDRLKPGTDAFDPKNPLIYVSGATTGTMVPCTASKFGVFAKSPATGFLGEAYSTGQWGAELRAAGIDILVITGKSPKPVYIFIDDGAVQVKSARAMWGKTTWEAEQMIRDELGDQKIRVSGIGQAGENKCRFACLINDHFRAAGRTGLGAVMGSKNLKAVALRGTKNVCVADPDGLVEHCKGLYERAKGPATLKYRTLGTAQNVLVLNAQGALPTRNFQGATWEHAEKVSGERFKAEFTVKTQGCSACPCRCEHVAVAKEGEFEGAVARIEYEPLNVLGPGCCVDDPNAIIKGIELANTMGMDAISIGVVASFAMECYEKGLITKEQCGGLELKFGDGSAMNALIEKIALRQDIGDVLAEGVKIAAEKIGGGAEKFANHVKGLELTGYEIRGLKTAALPVTNRAMVIGGGIAGINAALDMANMGYQVYLVEKDESIGGHMAQLDKTFPTLDCSICIEGPKMVEAARNPNIEVISFADILNVDGFIGNFKVRIRKNPRYVIGKNCTGCGECADVCPVEYPNAWEMNLGTRKAISVPFAQAVPLIFSIDKEHCIDCMKCVDICGGRNAIDFEQQPEEIEIEVGTITVATGFDEYKPTDQPQWGYGKYPNVVTGLEAERLINAAGPTGGEVVRASDGKHPKSVAFIQCVGSRDVNKHEYCTGFCCMYAIKEAILIKEHEPDTEIYILYMDMRTNFKGFEEFYRRARELGVTFIRGKVQRVVEDKGTNNLILQMDDTILGESIEVEAEMVILSTSGVPSAGTDDLARILHVTRDTTGFFLESHPKLKPIDAPVDGIFYAGACQGLKDIHYSVSQGSGAAGRAATILSKEIVEIEPIIAKVNKEKCLRNKANCTVCQKVCPYGACVPPADGVPMEINPAMCHGCGTCVADCPADAIDQMHFSDEQIFAQIRAALKENPEEKIMGFLCNWCCYSGADLAGTSRFEYPTRIRVIRTMCAGRVDNDFVMEALRLGAGAVFVGACHLPTDCHYISGNVWMKERMEKLHKRLADQGMSPERLRVAYVSAAEGLIFANIMKEMDGQLKDLGPDKIKAENDALRPGIEKILGKKGLLPA